jgi:hypothetical protein
MQRWRLPDAPPDGEQMGDLPSGAHALDELHASRSREAELSLPAAKTSIGQPQDEASARAPPERRVRTAFSRFGARWRRLAAACCRVIVRLAIAWLLWTARRLMGTWDRRARSTLQRRRPGAAGAWPRAVETVRVAPSPPPPGCPGGAVWDGGDTHLRPAARLGTTFKGLARPTPRWRFA